MLFVKNKIPWLMSAISNSGTVVVIFWELFSFATKEANHDY